MTEWLISVGTGTNQIPLIRSAKELGYKVMGLDRYPNEKVVDDFIPLSTYDYAEAYVQVAKAAKKHNFKGVLSRVSGPAVVTQSYLAERLALPSTSSKISSMSVAKSTLRKEATRAGVDTIKGQNYLSGQNIKPVYPCVVKPNQPLVGKKNVYLVNNLNKFIEARQKAAAESYDGQVEIQEFTEGDDIGFICAYHCGKLIWHMVYKENVGFVDGRCVGGTVSTTSLAARLENQILREITRFSESFGTSGFVFYSFKVSGSGNFKLYEVNPGLCGDNIADKLLPALWPTFDFFKADVQLCVGKLPQFPGPSIPKEREYIEV